MRFEQFSCMPYGPFAEQRLNFPNEGGDLQVILGRNEAGKSSLLRALQDFLFGIPPRTPDNFRFAYKDLGLEAQLRLADGNVVGARRVRKGQKSELIPLRAGVALLSELHLADLLGTVATRERYGCLCALSYDQLRQANEMLLSTAGDLGISLAGAGFGRDIAQIRAALESEARDLYKPRGSSQKLAQLDSQIEDLERRQRETSLRPADWEALVDAAETTKAEAERLRARWRDESARQQQLQRAIAALEQSQQLESRLAVARDELRTMPDEFPLLECDRPAQIASLASRLSVYQDRLEDLPKRQQELEELRRAIGVLQQRLPEPLRTDRQSLDVTQEAVLRELISAGRQTQNDLTNATRQEQEAERERQRATKELEELPADLDVTTLRDALEATASLPELYARLNLCREQLATLRDTRDAQFQRLVGYPGEPEVLAEIPLPRESLIQEQLKASEGLEQQGADIRRELRTLRESHAATSSRLDFVIREAVPALADLEAARAERERGWRMVRHHWLGDAAPESDAGWSDVASLPARYEAAVASADVLADRLRVEAQRVEERRSLELTLAELESRVAHWEAEDVSHQAAMEAWTAGWVELWSPVAYTPGSPDVALDWLRRAAECQQTMKQIALLRQQLDQCTEEQEACRQQLAAALESAGQVADEHSGAMALRKQAESAYQETEKGRLTRQERARQLQLITERVATATATLQQATAARAAWTGQWQTQLRNAQLSEDLPPEAIEALLAVLAELRPQEEGQATLTDRIGKIERDIAAYEAEAHRDLADLLPPGLAGPALSHRLVALQDDKEAQREDSKSREALLRTIATLEGEAASVKASLAELAPTIAGRTLEELQAAADDIAALLEELDAARDPASEAAALAQRAQEEADQQSGSASLAGEAAQLRAEFGALAADYLRLRGASMVLEASLESLQAASGAPVLERGSHWFARLTDGAFEGLEAEHDAHASVRAIRASDQLPLEVRQLSDGTRDQLFLALRLAMVEQYGQLGHEPLPLLLDDLLMTFDDARTAMTLAALAEISQVTQVLLFTHHGHVANLAGDVAGARVHRLGM